ISLLRSHRRRWMHHTRHWRRRWHIVSKLTQRQSRTHPYLKSRIAQQVCQGRNHHLWLRSDFAKSEDRRLERQRITLLQHLHQNRNGIARQWSIKSEALNRRGLKKRSAIFGDLAKAFD